MNKRNLVIVVVAVVLLAAAVVWHYSRPVEVQAAAVRRGDLVETLSAAGTVEAAQAEVSPKVVARVERLFVDEGDAVKAGDLLARLDDAQLRAAWEQSAARAASARAEAGLAESDYARMEELFAGGAASRALLDAARARLQAARANFGQAQAAMEEAEELLDECEVRAPMAGIVGRRLADVGDLAGPGRALFTIADSEDIWVAAEVDEEDLALVYVGQPVQITAESLARPVAGRVQTVGSVALPRGLEQIRAKIVRCKVIVEDDKGLLRPGMEVDVTGEATLAQEALLVPNEAVREIDGEAFVFVAVGGRLERRAVEIGRAGYRESVILSGVTEGEEVATTSPEELRDGQRVTLARE